jgi:hypothetical protein
MFMLTKSAACVARRALAIGQRGLRRYAHKYSPKLYTQPQLFACLVLKAFFKTDYRGIVILLEDLDSLAGQLRLRHVPHWTTLQKASKRLLTVPRANRLLTETLPRLLGRRRRVKRAAFDSTGLECGHTSHYFVRRRAKGASAKQKVRYSRFAKWEAAFECDSHVLLGVLASRGPRPDTDRFVPLLNNVLQRVKVTTALADAGYDSEANHRYARRRCGVRSVIPATIGRPTNKPPAGRYRRLMKQRLNKDYCAYGQRWQAETGFSMGKRRLGSAISGRSYWSRCRDVLLMAITFNIMLE